jgi:hypothetical protein
MGDGYGPHYPPTPKPPGLADRWVDVEDWQSFLKGLGRLQDPHYPNDVFDEATETATKWFQTTKFKAANYELPDTGCVNFATYQKAIREGMPKYKGVLTPNSCVVSAEKPIHNRPPMRTPGPWGGIATAPQATPDSFRDQWMKSPGYDTGTWNDILDWQNFLVANGYMKPNPAGTNNIYTPGHFDGGTNPSTTSTTTATRLFQNINGITTDPIGEVGPNTWSYANQFHTYQGGQNLVSHDGVTLTKESKAGCPPPP